MKEDEFDKHEFHADISEKVSSINEVFSDILDVFKNQCAEIENKDDVMFVGGGVQGIIDLFRDYEHKLHHIDQKYHRRFGELQVQEDRLVRFEKMVLESLEDIPITDAFDER